LRDLPKGQPEEAMAKPYAQIAPLSSLVLLAALVSSTACSFASDDRYAQGELVCKDQDACDAMWDAAEDWILRNSAGKLAENTDSLLETRCGRQAALFACYTVMRQPKRSGETQIHIYVACGNDFIGCEQPASKLRNELTAEMVRALSAGGTTSYTP
jgi:hypothetical protein